MSSDGMTESLLRTMLVCSRRVLEQPEDYDARAEVMWMGSLAHNDLLQCGNGTRGDWACHQLEHELGGVYDVTHGAGLAAVNPVSLIPYLYYPFAIGLATVASIVFRYPRRFSK